MDMMLCFTFCARKLISHLLSQAEDLTTNAESILTKVKKPTEVEARELAGLFRSSAPTRKRPLQAFDPSAECVALPQKIKKKAARPKPAKVHVFLLPNHVRKIPRGSGRKDLISNGRCKEMSFSRQMTALEVKMPF